MGDLFDSIKDLLVFLFSVTISTTINTRREEESSDVSLGWLTDSIVWYPAAWSFWISFAAIPCSCKTSRVWKWGACQVKEVRVSCAEDHTKWIIEIEAATYHFHVGGGLLGLLVVRMGHRLFNLHHVFERFKSESVRLQYHEGFPWCCSWYSFKNSVMCVMRQASQKKRRNALAFFVVVLYRYLRWFCVEEELIWKNWRRIMRCTAREDSVRSFLYFEIT